METKAAAAQSAATTHLTITTPPRSLTYITDEGPGIRRRRHGKGFSYRDPQNRPITDKTELVRIRKLAIPPAWTDVWISPDPDSHLQCTGRDAKGRKQYRYHPAFSTHRENVKFEHLLEFVEALPVIRTRISEDLKRRGLPREKILAAVVRLLETTLIRIGNDRYAKENKSFGLTTLRTRHITVDGPAIHFDFKGKSGKIWRLKVNDRRIASVLRRCQELPGQRLFQYRDEDGVRREIGSADVNTYLREITGQGITAKDFRTWAATVLAALELSQIEPPENKKSLKSVLRRAIEKVAAKLGNTPTICRKSYIHPGILQGFEKGALRLTIEAIPKEFPAGLEPEERAVLTYLHDRLALARDNDASKVHIAA